MDVAITGSTGLIGTALTADLERDGHRVLAVTRARPGPTQVGWDPDKGEIDAAGLEGLDAVVHLAGEPIASKRWTDEQKERIRTSRTRGTALVAETLAAARRPPKVLVSASGIHFYGERGDERCDEGSPAGTGYLSEVVAAWEAATTMASAAGIRTATIRTGIVLAPHGGPLQRMLPLFKLGLGGRFGSGHQYMSWITLADHVGAMRHLIDSDVSGPVNLTAPEPVTNREFTRTLGSVLKRPTFLVVPKFGPALVVGRELADELLFTSIRVLPTVLSRSGYEFAHPHLETGLRAVLDK